MSASLIANYSQAAKLAQPQQSLGAIVDSASETKKGSKDFQQTLSSVMNNLYQGVKQQGHTTETHLSQQIMGVGNIEETAMSLAELNANLDVVAQGLRIAVEKITELTTRTMGG